MNTVNWEEHHALQARVEQVERERDEAIRECGKAITELTDRVKTAEAALRKIGNRQGRFISDPSLAYAEVWEIARAAISEAED